MIIIAETTTNSVQNAIDQTKEALMPAFYTILKYALIIAAIAFIFMFVRFLIVKAIKKSKSDQRSTKKKNFKDEGREYYLNNDELEAIRLYSKLTENEKITIKQEMKEIIRK